MSNSLAAVHPEFVSGWSEKNLPSKPDEVKAKSRKNVWWRCSINAEVTLQYFCDTAGCVHIIRRYVLSQMRKAFPVMTKIFFPDLRYDSVKCFQ